MLLVFIQELWRGYLVSDKIKPDILIDEHAMSIMEEEVLRQTILYFEREMM